MNLYDLNKDMLVQLITKINSYFRKKHGLDKTHPHVIFVDDIDKYLRNVKKHVPTAFVYKRQILDDYL